jgi:Uma2 family endonuclease
MNPMTAALFTADEYIASGDTRPRWTELVDGEVFVNTPSVRHQRIVQYINTWLFVWATAQPGRGEAPGQLDIRITESSVLAPDALWFANGKLPTNDAPAAFVIPELVVEVRSPSTWTYDTTVKFRKYEAAGVAEVWMVDTASNTVLVYRRSSPEQLTFDVSLELGISDTLSTPLLEEFAMNVGDLFNR